MSFKRSVLLTFLVHLLIIVVDKGAGFVVLKILEDKPDLKGQIDLLTVLPPILMAVANLGFATSLVYYLRRREFSVQVVGETSSFLALVWGSFLALVAFAAAQIAYSLDPLTTGRPSLHLMLPIVIVVPFMLTTSYMNSVQLATGRIRQYNLVHMLQSVPFLPVFLLLYLAGNVGVVESAVYGKVVLWIGTCLLTVLMVRGVFRWRPRFHKGFFRRGIAYGWRANVNSTLTYLNHRIDLFLVWTLFLASSDGLRKEEVAFYSLAVTLAELIWHFPEAMRDLFFSRVAGQSREESQRFTPLVCRNLFVVSAVCALGIWLTASPALGLFIRTWEASWAPKVMPALTWLLPGTLLFTVSKVLQADLAARGRINETVFASATVLLSMCALDLWWVPEHGAVGAARASTVAYAAGTLYTLYVYSKTSGVGWLACLIPQRADLEHYRRAWQEFLGRGAKPAAGEAGN